MAENDDRNISGYVITEMAQDGILKEDVGKRT